ncbi:uncharacterized protein LOC142620431 [Castanea sativa]|uniref:uncharacterized protein LOC142620431 n=1 Tax=Castanea sativa TaxID=21020 RepID=UPI003F651CDF
MLAAQEVLKRGCCWRVGIGYDIRVMTDEWIPNHPSNMVICQPQEVKWEWRVMDLIDWTVGAWDRHLIETTFHKEDADAILQIPLSRRLVPDSLFWLHNRDGVYSVKSGYRVACKILKEANSACELCKRTTETALHALWECSVAQEVWAGSMRKQQKAAGSQLDFLHLVEVLMLKLSREELELFFVQAWLIWTQRNSVVFGGVIQDPSRLVKRAGEFLDEFKQSQVQLAVTRVETRCSRWIPPLGSTFKLNFDAAIFQDIKSSGFRAVIRNNQGEVMAALSARGPSVQDSEEAEVLACRKALEFTIDSGFSNIVIEGDNSVVMAAIPSSRLIHSRLGNLYADIHCLVAGLQVHSVSSVARFSNLVAHSLARFAHCINDEIIWLEESPQPALEALYVDSN